MNGRATPPSRASRFVAGGAVLVAGMVAAGQLAGPREDTHTTTTPNDRGRVYAPAPPAEPSPAERGLLRLHGPRAGRAARGVASIDFPHAGPPPGAGAAGAASVLQRLPLRRRGLEVRLAGSADRPAVLVSHRTTRPVAARTWRSLLARHAAPAAPVRVIYRPVGRRALGTPGAAALAAARSCAGGYAAYTVGRATGAAVGPVSPGLARNLADHPPRVPPAMRGADPRVRSARLVELASSRAIATVAIAGLPLTQRLTVRLQRAGDGWHCTRIGAAR